MGNLNFGDSFRFKQQECIVYLEALVKTEDGQVNAYVDFRTYHDLSLFRNIVSFSGNFSYTFLELCGIKSYRSLRRGCYYKLNISLLKNYRFETNNNSFLIAAAYDLREMPMPLNEEEEVLQSHEVLDSRDLSMAHVPPGKVFDDYNTDNLKLFVKDVGQANWNELRCGDDVKVVYDAGASLDASESEVKRLFDDRINELRRTKPILVISHWDMDHIHCLALLNYGLIKDCFSRIVCPDRLKSVTSHRILDLFINALGRKNVYCLPMPARTNGVTMHHWRTEGCISLYTAESSRNTNYCGLVMFVKGKNRSANYTGDCKLIQAKDVYDQEKSRGIRTNEHILIAPHHGGDCGIRSRVYSSPCNTIEISVGSHNRYKHPHKNMLRYLKSLGTIKQTKDVGDIIEYL